MSNNSIYYRGIANKENDISMPSAYRFGGSYDYEKDIYKYVVDNYKNFAFISKKKESIFQKIRFISIMQHYGFPTRLLDVTKNYDVALYFACCSDFSKDGAVGTLDIGKNKKDIREIKGSECKVIDEKINLLIGKYSIGALINEIKRRKEHLGDSISKNIILNYKKVFGTSVHNERCEKQEGSFIMFGNVIDNGVIKGELNNKVELFEIEKISKEHKLEKLFELAMKKISYAVLFPDSEETIRITNIKNKGINNISLDDLIYINPKIKFIPRIIQDDILNHIKTYASMIDVLIHDYVNYLLDSHIDDKKWKSEKLKLNNLLQKKGIK